MTSKKGKPMQKIYFTKASYIKEKIIKNKIENVIVETGERNTYIPEENKFIVTKELLKDSTNVFFLGYDATKLLKTIDLSNFDFSEIQTMNSWFSDNLSLEKIIFPKEVKTTTLSDFSSTFHNCDSLLEVDLSWVNTQKEVEFIGTFSQCKNLKSFILPKVKTNSINILATNAYNLKKAILPIDWTIKADADYNTAKMNIFRGCNDLQIIDFSDGSFKKENMKKVETLEELLSKNNNLLNVPETCTIILPN